MMSVRSKVLEISSLSEKIRLFRIQKPEGFSFSPGQFAILSIEGVAGKEGALAKRSYSIASSPYEAHLEFCIVKAGFFSSAMHGLKEGDFVNVQGPFGAFILNKPLPSGTIFVAGGSGISPLISMIRSMDKEDCFPAGFRLFYGFRHPSEYVFREELESLHGQGKINLVASIDKPAGEWNGEVGFVSEVLGRHSGIEKSDAYLCGPPQMTSATIKVLLSLGFQEKRIHHEQW